VRKKVAGWGWSGSLGCANYEVWDWTMLGDDVRTDNLFSYLSCEARVPQDHPLRPIHDARADDRDIHLEVTPQRRVFGLAVRNRGDPE
jgi:hypothetical protein